MKRLKFLLEERARIEGEMSSIFAKCETENRSRSTEEKTKWDSLDAELNAMADEIKALEHQQQIDARSARPVGSNPANPAPAQPAAQIDMSLRAQIQRYVDSNRETLEAIKNGSRRELPAMELRAAASPMTPANTLTNTITVNAGVVPQFESGFHDVRRLQPTFWDYIPKGRSDSAAYSWVNKKVGAGLGAAAFIGPGVAKPGISFTLEREVSNAKKIAVSDKIATELLMDVSGFESMVRGEMTYQLKQKTNTTLMTAAVSSTVPAGIQTISVPFSLAGIDTDNANNFDSIRALVAQLAVGFFQGLPVTVFINPVDGANMDLSKAISNGTYLLPPFSTNDGRRVAGATVVEDNNIPAGFVQAACLDLYKILIYQDLTIQLGWENDDFTKNLVTYIAEMRIHQFYSSNDAGAFIYDSFANIKEHIMTT